MAASAAHDGARSPWLRGELAIEALRNDPSGTWEGRYVLWAGDHLWGAYNDLKSAESAVTPHELMAEMETSYIVTKLEEQRVTTFARAVVQTYRRNAVATIQISVAESSSAL
jgi:hypothetical protein